MPSVRSLILLAVTILVISLVTSSLSLLRVPDSGGQGQDSFGIRGSGYRGLFDALGELGVEVRRQFTPPEAELPEATLAMLAPDPMLVGTNPVYLKSIDLWLQEGGRLVVAPRGMNWLTMLRAEASPAGSLPTLAEILELPDIAIETSTTYQAGSTRRASPGNRLGESFAEEVMRTLAEELKPPRIIDVDCDGTLSAWAPSVGQLALPGDTHQTLTWKDSQPSGTIGYQDDAGERQILAAEFARGDGQILFVSDPALLSNRLVSLADNSVFAARVLSPQGEGIVFDEFYHGLGVRGNPLYLLTRPGYATIAIGLLASVLLFTWREAVLIGPPLPDRSHGRRDIGEYLVAMGHFFSKGSATRPFLVRELRLGVLRELSLAVSLPPETRDIDLITAAISRRDVRWGRRVNETINEIDTALESRHHWTESQTLDALRRLTACL